MEGLRDYMQQRLGLPDDAISYLCDLFQAIQALDDFVDGDDTTREEKDLAVWNSLAGLQLNPFYIANSVFLLPLVANAILKWKAADTAERQGANLHMAYAWRAGFYDIVLQCVLLAHGHRRAMELAPDVMAFYGESFQSYEKEFAHA